MQDGSEPEHPESRAQTGLEARTQESCSRHFPASWPPHTCLLKAGFLAPKSEWPETWGEASLLMTTGPSRARKGCWSLSRKLQGSSFAVSLLGQTWKDCRRCSPPRGEEARSSRGASDCLLLQVCRAEVEQVGWHPASCPVHFPTTTLCPPGTPWLASAPSPLPGLSPVTEEPPCYPPTCGLHSLL